MSEKITANNLDEVVKRNNEIKSETDRLVLIIKTDCNKLSVQSTALLGIQLLKEHGLIMMPIDNPYLGGAIYVKDGKKIPFINTAQPRANQYFTAWHEVYHLLFDKVSFDYLTLQRLKHVGFLYIFTSKYTRKYVRLMSFYKTFTTKDTIASINDSIRLVSKPFIYFSV